MRRTAAIRSWTGTRAGGNQITDNELPAGNWTGAIVHIKNIRWSMLDRQVTSSSGQTLTLNQGLSCLISGWGNCIGWGYFINNSAQHARSGRRVVLRPGHPAGLPVLDRRAARQYRRLGRPGR